MSGLATGKAGGRKPEFLRKFIVSLKRSPQTIALLALVICFLEYSLNLTHVSDTTAKIQGVGMGLCGFATMLFSMLSFVCFLNSFPKRKKPNIPMIILMFLMFGIIFYCDNYYLGRITSALTRAENPIEIGPTTMFIQKASSVLHVHMILLGISVALIVLLPVYSRMLRKIDTSIVVEDNGTMAEIDISGEN